MPDRDLDPRDASRQPLLRLVDTVIGIDVGVACSWITGVMYSGLTGRPAR